MINPSTVKKKSIHHLRVVLYISIEINNLRETLESKEAKICNPCRLITFI